MAEAGNFQLANAFFGLAEVIRLGEQPVIRVEDVERLLAEQGVDQEEMVAFLIRGRRRTSVTLRTVVGGTAAAEALLRARAAVAPTESAEEPGVLERAIELEIRRLHERISGLERQLEALRERP